MMAAGTREGLQQLSLLKVSDLVSQSMETDMSERKELTIENLFVITRDIHWGVLYSMYYITGKLYAIQIGSLQNSKYIYI